MTRWYNNDPSLGDRGPFDMIGYEADEVPEALAEELAQVFDSSVSTLTEQLKKALVPAVVVRRSNGDYVAKGSGEWVWTSTKERAQEFPSDQLGDLEVDDEVTQENFFANSTDADFLDVGWGDERGDIYAQAELAW